MLQMILINDEIFNLKILKFSLLLMVKNQKVLYY